MWLNCFNLPQNNDGIDGDDVSCACSLSEVSLDIAEHRQTGQRRAFEVEHCQCPPGYSGLSCEGRLLTPQSTSDAIIVVLANYCYFVVFIHLTASA